MDFLYIKELILEKLYNYVIQHADYITEYYQFIIVISLIIISWLINKFDRNSIPDINFKYDDMPVMRPIRIPTADVGFWGALRIWLFERRRWELTEDFYFYIDGVKYIIPKGFDFDGASIPKFLNAWLSPVGVLLIASIIHDWLYKNTYLAVEDGSDVHFLERDQCDKLFREINISVNGFTVLNYTCWIALKLFGFIAWNKYRK